MKKHIALLAMAVMVLSSTVTMSAMAAKSPTTKTVKTETATVEAKTMASGVSANTVTVDGVATTATITPLSTATIAEGKVKAMTMISKDANILKAFDVSVGNANFKEAKIAFNVPGVVAGQRLFALHQKKDGSWEVIKNVKVDNGIVTVTFSSLSPVFLVSGKASDKTGETLPIIPIVIMVVCLGGAAFFGKKYASAK